MRWDLTGVLGDEQYQKRWKGEIKASCALKGELGVWNRWFIKYCELGHKEGGWGNTARVLKSDNGRKTIFSSSTYQSLWLEWEHLFSSVCLFIHQ